MTKNLGIWACVAGMAAACSSSPSTNDAGTTTDAGTNTSTDAGTKTDAGAPAKTYCDGFGATDTSGDLVLAETYEFGKTLKTEGCSAAIEAYADGTALTQLGGVFDVNGADGTSSSVLFVTNCGDPGLDLHDRGRCGHCS
jgi:hypothetical protein